MFARVEDFPPAIWRPGLERTADVRTTPPCCSLYPSLRRGMRIDQVSFDCFTAVFHIVLLDACALRFCRVIYIYIYFFFFCRGAGGGGGEEGWEEGDFDK